jgi:hypothetical protein
MRKDEQVKLAMGLLDNVVRPIFEASGFMYHDCMIFSLGSEPVRARFMSERYGFGFSIAADWTEKEAEEAANHKLKLLGLRAQGSK